MTSVSDLMLDWQEVILNWLRDVTSLEVVLSESSDPRPDTPYVSFKIISGLSKIGSRDEQIPEDSNAGTSYRVVHRRNITVSVEGIGRQDDDPDRVVRAMDILSQVQNSLDLPTTLDRFRAIGLAIRDDFTVTDVPEPLATENEPRAVFDIIFGVTMFSEDDPGKIESVTIDGGLDSDFDGTENIEIDDTVTSP